MTLLLVVCVASLFLLEGCASATPENSVPHLHHLGQHYFRITTRSREAQHAFDRGLNLAYSFGHYAAEQEFRNALKADRSCAMAYWGIALVNGPHINFPFVPPDKAAIAWEALRHAKDLAGPCSPLEQELIKALESRYASPQPEDRTSLDANYASAMRAVCKAYPASADAATLFAEAAMDLHPWNFWTNGVPQPWTSEIQTALQSALKIDPNHPGANHFYIHVMEASPYPEQAVAHADRLRKLVPDSSHMVHMPAHIYSRVGDWEKAATANRKAVKADALYRAAYPRPGFYSMYMAHNSHFLAWVYMMQARSQLAVDCAHQTVAGIPDDFLKEYTGVVDGYMAIVPETLMRFGRWNEILKEPQPAEGLPLARALWHFTRASALIALDRNEEAKTEQGNFVKAIHDVPADRGMGNNTASDLLAIANLVLEGELSAKRADYSTSVAKLKQAVLLEDKLRYDEPPDWIQPVRHTLGAVLLRAGKPSEAEVVYQEDLRRNPENGWGLLGLRDSLQAQGKARDARRAQQRLNKTWAKADVSPDFTCYCQASK